MSQKAKTKTKSRQKSKKGRARRVVDSWRLKKWYEVYAPISFKNAFIGLIPSGNPDNLIGRTVETLLYDFTHDFKHAHIKVKFKITEVKGERCETRFVGHEITRDYERSLIHRGTSRIDAIFNYKTADGFVFRVSTLCVTTRRTKGSQKKTIRKIIHQILTEFAKSSKHGKFVRGMLYGQYANNIAKIAKTIYPLKECIIRKSKLISFPEGAVEEEVDEDEVFEEKTVKLKVHGKQIKAKKRARKSQQKAAQQQEKKAAAKAAEKKEKAEKKEEKKEEKAADKEENPAEVKETAEKKEEEKEVKEKEEKAAEAEKTDKEATAETPAVETEKAPSPETAEVKTEEQKEEKKEEKKEKKKKEKEKKKEKKKKEKKKKEKDKDKD